MRIDCVCVWQLVNLIHAINYVMSLTDGTRRISRAQDQNRQDTYICLLSIWFLSRMFFSLSFLMSCANFLIFLSFIRIETWCSFFLHISLPFVELSLHVDMLSFTHGGILFTSTSLSQHMRTSMVQIIIPHCISFVYSSLFAVVQFNENFQYLHWRLFWHWLSFRFWLTSSLYQRHERDEMSFKK